LNNLSGRGLLFILTISLHPKMCLHLPFSRVSV
jgi:hypothetical protein